MRVRGETTTLSLDDNVFFNNHSDVSRSGETTFLLATVGAAAGAAFLGGTLAGSLGVVTGTIFWHSSRIVSSQNPKQLR